MTHITARKLKALETKKALLETGLELFDKKGFDNVTVDEIVKTCNVSKGAFYVHFNSKYDIFNEKFKDIDNFYSEFQKGISNDIKASEKILIFFEAQMVYLRDELGKDLIRTVYMNAMSLTINKNHYLSDPNRNLYQVINSFVQEGIKNKEFKEGLTTEEVSVLITRCMRGTIYDWIIFGEQFDIVEEMNKFTSTVLDGLKRQ
ncbi:TetR/AcrR family transcriptional regulator [Oceanobacillus sp. FSL W7-1281]|uniref:TetR/AcrR family transcriptional regulator n=2 Tax=Bacillaceae TaxID=186817 RepID=UPI0030DC7A1D